MSEPARNPSPHDTLLRPSNSGPLRDWLAAMRATAPEGRQEVRQDSRYETRQPEPAAEAPAAEKAAGWAPRLVAAAAAPREQDEEVAEIVAENMMLKAKLRLEADRRDELQLLLAQEIRELRAHVAEEVAKLDDLRGERDLWKARCEALMQPLFQRG